MEDNLRSSHRTLLNKFKDPHLSIIPEDNEVFYLFPLIEGGIYKSIIPTSNDRSVLFCSIATLSFE